MCYYFFLYRKIKKKHFYSNKKDLHGKKQANYTFTNILTWKTKSLNYAKKN